MIKLKGGPGSDTDANGDPDNYPKFSRMYKIDLVISTLRPPSMAQFNEIGPFVVRADRNSTIITPPIIDGTYAPTTFSYSTSDEITSSIVI